MYALAGTFSLGIGRELLEAVNEVGSVERVATDAHASGLAEANRRGLGNGLIRESARPRNDTWQKRKEMLV